MIHQQANVYTRAPCLTVAASDQKIWENRLRTQAQGVRAAATNLLIRYAETAHELLSTASGHFV